MNPFQTIQREEVGTSLKITPQINEGSGVKLDIEQETSSLERVVEGAADLVTNTRTITTSVFVNDGDVLVLGGLIDDQLRQGEQRVPGLGQDPRARAGCSARARTDREQDQSHGLHPADDPARRATDARFQTNSKYRYIQDLQRQMAEDPVQLMREDEPRPRAAAAAQRGDPRRSIPRRRHRTPHRSRWQRTPNSAAAPGAGPEGRAADATGRCRSRSRNATAC